MSDCTKAFESIARAAGFNDFEVSGNGCYSDDFLQHFYAGWEARETCRQALESEPFTWVFTDVNGQAKEIAGDPVHRSPQDLRIYTALYTHPASSQAGEGEPVYVLLSCNSDSPEPTFIEIETEEGVSVSVPWHHHEGFDRVGPLYTHPVSADVPSGMSDRLDVLAQGLENLQRNSGSDAYQWGFIGAMLKDVKSMISDCAPQLEDRPGLGQRKAAQIGQIIGVLVQNQDGKVAAVTDLGRCTWLNQDVTVAGGGASVPDGVWEALQRLIENGASLGPASMEDALLVATHRKGLLTAPTKADECCCGECEQAWRLCPLHSGTPKQEQDDE